jgi:hypothetical protein
MSIPKRTTGTTERTRSSEGMHVCPRCDSQLVQPVEWFEQGDRRWHVDLRCPECHWEGNGSFTQDQVDRFDEELDHGAQALIEDLRSFTQANMEEEISAFTDALMADRILPEDF